MSSAPDRLLVSVHDVMPETLDEVDGILALLARHGLGRPNLLVVPGRAWDEASLARLKRYAGAGHELVAHGFEHAVGAIRGFRHRLHSLVLSRKVAEHLALDADGIETLIRRSSGWFAEQGLPRASLYVPPAWALGAIPRARLEGLGFRYYETLGGIYDSETGSMRRIPVVGFEADTALRAFCLRAVNAIQLRLAKRAGALRVAIHPHDLRLRLAGDLLKLLDALPAYGSATLAYGVEPRCSYQNPSAGLSSRQR